MSQYIATGAVMVGLPLYLLKHSINSMTQNEKIMMNHNENDKTVNENDRIMPKLSYLHIQKEGLLTRIFASSACYTVIMGLYFYKYPSNKSTDPNVHYIRFMSLTIIDQWKWKMIEMTMSGKEFFIKNNIMSSWQVILSWIIGLGRIDFNKCNMSNIRQKALLHLAEQSVMISILYVIHNKYNKNVPDKFCLKIPLNLLPIFIGLVFGNNINIRYCYSHPFLSLNLRAFWKRWSIHIGEPLRNYVYIPFGGNKYPIFSSLMVFIINGLDHIGFAGILNGGFSDKSDKNSSWISIAKSFVILGCGTVLDSFLYSYFVKKKKKEMFVNSLRFLLMYSTIIGQAML